MSETKTCPSGIISVNPYLTTYERHYQPADRKSQTGPLYKLIQFFKTFENKFLLFLWNAATCIRHRKESCPVICFFEFEHNRTFFSKLNSIHQQNQNKDQKQDQKDEQKEQNKDQKNQDKKDQQQNQNQQQQQNKDEMSKENAQQLLNAVMQDEKNVQDKVKKQMQIRGKKLDKDW